MAMSAVALLTAIGVLETLMPVKVQSEVGVRNKKEVKRLTS